MLELDPAGVASLTPRGSAAHKWAALELAHSFPAQPSLTLLGPRADVLILVVAAGIIAGRLSRR